MCSVFIPPSFFFTKLRPTLKTKRDCESVLFHLIDLRWFLQSILDTPHLFEGNLNLDEHYRFYRSELIFIDNYINKIKYLQEKLNH